MSQNTSGVILCLVCPLAGSKSRFQRLMCLSWLVPLSLHKNFEVHLCFTKNTQRSRHVPPCPQKRISQIYLALLLWFKILGMSFSIQNAAVMDNF